MSVIDIPEEDLEIIPAPLDRFDSAVLDFVRSLMSDDSDFDDIPDFSVSRTDVDQQISIDLIDDDRSFIVNWQAETITSDDDDWEDGMLTEEIEPRRYILSLII